MSKRLLHPLVVVCVLFMVSAIAYRWERKRREERASEGFRVWTTLSGERFEAKFVGKRFDPDDFGEYIVLRTPDGEEVLIGEGDLTTADCDWIEMGRFQKVRPPQLEGDLPPEPEGGLTPEPEEEQPIGGPFPLTPERVPLLQD